jgi:hypothetical protein
MDRDWDETIDSAVRLFQLNARLKWKGDSEPSGWGWVISPVRGYLEAGGIGPIPVREVEWVEFDLTRRRKLPGVDHREGSISVSDVAAAFGDRGSLFDPATNILRLFPPQG